MEFTSISDEKCHSNRFTYITFPRNYLVCFAAVFLKLRWHSSATNFHSGRQVGACGKNEVLPQPDGSILSGGTVYEIIHICTAVVDESDE